MESLFIMTHGSVTPRPVGLQMSVLRRCMAFAHHNIAHTLLINEHYLSHESSLEALRADGLLDPQTYIRYMHNELAGDVDKDDREIVDVLASYDDCQVVSDEKNQAIRRLYREGSYVGFVWLDRQRVVFIDNLIDGVRTDRSSYDARGYLRKVESVGKDNQPIRTRLYGRCGNHYLTINKATNPDDERPPIELITPSGEHMTFGSNEELVGHWLQFYVLHSESKSLLISEYGFFRRALQHLRQLLPELRVVYTLHNNHLAGTNRYGAPVKRELADFFNHIHEYDGVVVLTEEQRVDIYKQFHPVRNVSVIPHHAVVDEPDRLERDPFRVVMLGRFAEHKGQVDGVRAFRKVVDIVPQARLEIYGRGPTEAAIRDEIASQGLSDNVQIMGFSNGSKDVYSSSAVGLFPTAYEGFGLAIQESMQYGCVPVAYDSKYGIRALIRDGIDGLIVDRGNVAELADSILLLLRNSELRQAYATAGLAIYDRFSEDIVVGAWRRIFEEVFVPAMAEASIE